MKMLDTLKKLIIILMIRMYCGYQVLLDIMLGVFSLIITQLYFYLRMVFR